MTVKTRIAPSPTGDPHVGTAYIALFNLCFARKHGGRFILRIEDTDQVRSTTESERQILESLRWLGLEWDEGPDVGGPCGPYRQSERMAIYARHCDQLLKQGDAFHCFCTAERLDALRERQREEKLTLGYDGHCLRLTEQEVAQKLAQRIPHVVRMKVPREGVCEVQDRLRGKIEIEWTQVDMQVLMKGDGMPTYHLANVVDDHLMEITHVIRGEEWISSAPKHLLLYRQFGWTPPELIHLPLLRNPDKSKLSKRKNPTSILYYRRMGYLAEAMLNYLGRMGWSMPDEREKFTLQEMLEHFDLDRVSLGGPIFDTEKLDWLNGQWIREDLSDDQLLARFQQWAFNDAYIRPMLPHLRTRIEKLSDAAPLAGFFFAGLLDLQPGAFEFGKLDQEQVVQILQLSVWRLEALQEWNRDAIFQALQQIANAQQIKIRDFLQPLFVAIAGTTASVSVVDSMEILGSDLTRARLRHALQLLGGVSKKNSKTLEKMYREMMRGGEGESVEA